MTAERDTAHSRLEAAAAQADAERKAHTQALASQLKLHEQRKQR